MKEKIKIVFLALIFIALLILISSFINTKTSNELMANDVSEERIIELSDNDFDSFVSGSDKKILVDFYATWCGPCKMLSPIIEEIAGENNDVEFVKVDIDKCGMISNRFRVQSIPTLVVIENGNEINRSVGLIDKNQVEELIK